MTEPSSKVEPFAHAKHHGGDFAVLWRTPRRTFLCRLLGHRWNYCCKYAYANGHQWCERCKTSADSTGEQLG